MNRKNIANNNSTVGCKANSVKVAKHRPGAESGPRQTRRVFEASRLQGSPKVGISLSGKTGVLVLLGFGLLLRFQTTPLQAATLNRSDQPFVPGGQRNPPQIIGSISNDRAALRNKLNPLPPFNMDAEKVPLQPAMGNKVVIDINGHTHPFMIDLKDIDGNVISEFDAEGLHDLLQNHPQYDKADIFRINGCEAGADPEGLAQQLANLSGRPVLAPNGTIMYSPNNARTSIEMLHNELPPGEDYGRYKLFTPRPAVSAEAEFASSANKGGLVRTATGLSFLGLGSAVEQLANLKLMTDASEAGSNLKQQQGDKTASPQKELGCMTTVAMLDPSLRAQCGYAHP